MNVATNDTHQRIVSALDTAERTRAPLPPLTETYTDLTQVDAYTVQAAWLERKLSAGGRLVGRKVGLTSLAMQKQLGVNEPDFGFLLHSMLVTSGSTLRRAELLQPRVEPEIAFWLAADLRGPGVTIDAVLAATRGVSAALEIVDSRIADWRIKLVDTIADNGSSARAVVSDRVVPVADLDLPAETVALFKNDIGVGAGAGSDVLEHPAQAVAWLANRLADFGAGLQAGQVVLPGAMCASVFAQAGETFRAEFPRLGAVHVSFV
jgi:2-oxopent-4-enoate hydratase